MLQIIKPARTKTEVAYRRIFRSIHECHGFPCDDQGEPILNSPVDRMLFKRCVEKEHLKDCGRVRREYTRTYPAIAKCECGQMLKLEKKWDHESILCRCGRRYNKEGKELTLEKERSLS